MNCFNRLRVLAEVSTKLQKMHLSKNLKTITWERNMETRPIILFFFHLLLPLYLFEIFIAEFENTQILFSCGPPFGPFWPVKYLNFWPETINLVSSL